MNLVPLDSARIIAPLPEDLKKFSVKCGWLLTQSPARTTLWIMYHHFDQNRKAKLEGLAEIGYTATRNVGPCVYVERNKEKGEQEL